MNEEPIEPALEENPPAVPAPDYPTPPSDSPPPAIVAGQPRHMVAIIATGVVLALLVVAVIGYGAAGQVFASSRIASTRTTYIAVVAHQNAITDEFNAFDKSVTGVNLTSATAAQLNQTRASYETLVSQSVAAQPTIAADDAALASAQARLNENSWLTLFARSDLNKASARMGHERKALAAAKTITGDLVQLGTFYQAFYDVLIDLDNLNTKAQATDFTGSAAAVATLKTDIAKSIQLSSAPGLPPEMKVFLTDFQTLAADFGKLLDAAIAGDISGASTYDKAVQADITTVYSHDLDKISNQIIAFYQPMIDTFNSEIAKANSL